jgi:pimeloyl-ACP methyl ester carboxylesterase
MPDLVRPTAVARLAHGQVEYRLEQRGDAVVLVFHGGHVRAGLALGENVFAAAGCTVLAPSRPGYGRTPLSTGRSVQAYSDVVRALCAHLGINRVAAVVGVSGGGPTAATMAARHADLVERLILISAVGWLPYPDPWTRLGSHLAFNVVTEHLTWAGMHALARLAPDVCLRLMLKSLSTRPASEVVAALRPEGQAAVAGPVRPDALRPWVPQRSTPHARHHRSNRPAHTRHRHPHRPWRPIRPRSITRQHHPPRRTHREPRRQPPHLAWTRLASNRRAHPTLPRNHSHRPHRGLNAERTIDASTTAWRLEQCSLREVVSPHEHVH